MTTTPRVSDERLAQITARAEAATPGPWERGNYWHIQGEKHCPCLPQWGPANERRMDINGTKMLAHSHRLPEPVWEAGIYTRDLHDGHPASVVIETSEYGLMDPADAAHIANVDPSTVLDLIADLRDARADNERLTVERDAAQEHVAYHLRDFQPTGDMKLTGDLAVDMAAYAGRLRIRAEAAEAENERLTLDADGRILRLANEYRDRAKRAEARVRDSDAAIARVEALHAPVRIHPEARFAPWCGECSQGFTALGEDQPSSPRRVAWPCKTATALGMTDPLRGDQS